MSITNLSTYDFVKHVIVVLNFRNHFALADQFKSICYKEQLNGFHARIRETLSYLHMPKLPVCSICMMPLSLLRS